VLSYTYRAQGPLWPGGTRRSVPSRDLPGYPGGNRGAPPRGVDVKPPSRGGPGASREARRALRPGPEGPGDQGPRGPGSRGPGSRAQGPPPPLRGGVPRSPGSRTGSGGPREWGFTSTPRAGAPRFPGSPGSPGSPRGSRRALGTSRGGPGDQTPRQGVPEPLPGNRGAPARGVDVKPPPEGSWEPRFLPPFEKNGQNRPFSRFLQLAS